MATLKLVKGEHTRKINIQYSVSGKPASGEHISKYDV